MHKGVILLVKAVSRDDAKTKSTDFLDEFKGTVLDWYVIGGRWARELNPLKKKFDKLAHDICKEDNNTVYQSTVEKNDVNLQNQWESIGGNGSHPWSDHYRLPEEGTEDDIKPLSECVDIVKEWKQNPEEEYELRIKEAESVYGKSSENGYNKSMFAYLIKKAAEVLGEEFCFDCNIFNIETYNYSIPEDIKNYYAVMVDMHN